MKLINNQSIGVSVFKLFVILILMTMCSFASDVKEAKSSIDSAEAADQTVNSVDKWISEIKGQHPELRLLQKKESPNSYIVVFLEHDSTLALCRYDIHLQKRFDVGAIHILDTDGKTLEQKGGGILCNEYTYSNLNSSKTVRVAQGLLIPIQMNYIGKATIHFLFDNKESEVVVVDIPK